MKKRIVFILLCACVLLTGCAKQVQPDIWLLEAEPAAAQESQEDTQKEAVLTLGVIDFDSEKELLRTLIQKYNASGAGVRIEILNYADGAESRADAATRMTTALMAGDVPDLLDCSDLSGAQYAGYAKNGILLPLDEMQTEDILPGVLEPCRVDGTLYSIVGAFALDPLFGPAEKLGASLETSVLDVLRGEVAGAHFVWGGKDLLGVYCRHAAEQFLDYDTQTASFESNEFVDILTACAQIVPSELGPDSIMQQPMRAVNMYRQMRNAWYQQTGSAFCVLAIDQSGGTAYQPILQLGICAGSENREAAQAALSAMLGEAFQQPIVDAFPVSRTVLREQMRQEIEAQKAEQQTAIREEGRVEIGEAGDLAFLFDEAAADDLMNVLEHVNCRACGNQEILTIILEGQKTAQEAAQVMDRRAALFIAEVG